MKKYFDAIMAGMADREKGRNLISMCLVRLLFSVMVFGLVAFLLIRIVRDSASGAASMAASCRMGMALNACIYASIGVCCFGILKNGFPIICISFPMVWEVLLKLLGGRQSEASRPLNVDGSGSGSSGEGVCSEEESVEQRILDFIRTYKQVKIVPFVFFWLQRNGSLRGETRDEFRRIVERKTGVKVSGSHMSQTITDLNAILDKDDGKDEQVKEFLRVSGFLETIVAPGQALSIEDKSDSATGESRITLNKVE